MPRVIVTRTAQRDLERLRKFLHDKNPQASKRAAQAIKDGIKKIAAQPEGCRPITDMPYHRELVIDFGNRGYVARYYYQPGGDVLILRIKHQLEDDLPQTPQ
jgi:plasmid stabilization system protein ParE